MFRFFLAVFLIGTGGLAPNHCQAQNTKRTTPAPAKRESFLGLFFSQIPEPVYFHLPQLAHGQGILIDQVRSNSPAATIGLKRYDILLSFDGKEINSSGQFVSLVGKSRNERKVPLVLIRRGKAVTLQVDLQGLRKNLDNFRSSIGKAKNGRPPKVSVEATMMDKGRLEVTFEYYAADTGKLKRDTFKGSLDEISLKLKTLPSNVQNLAKVALDRLRTRNRN